jgi:hypothetical protein
VENKFHGDLGRGSGLKIKKRWDEKGTAGAPQMCSANYLKK